VYHAYNHETEGLPIIKNFLSRLTNEKALEACVLNLAKLHMKPNTLATHKSSVKATNKMFSEAREPLDLVLLAIADNRGRRCEYEPYDTEPFLSERLSIYEEYMARPFVAGRDLIEAGLAEGKDFSEILAYAHKLRLAGIPKDAALKQTLAYAAKMRKQT
ncbi:MAG: tRNA nucleotidyltransferase, partial [Clostridia bacterium]|nr:tRNA nucleotidyltransferase [Clostridia bacterium]